MEPDPYLYSHHYCDPGRGKHTAVCGRGHPANMNAWPQDVDCPDCVAYLRDMATPLLELYEEATVRLRELEDE